MSTYLSPYDLNTRLQDGSLTAADVVDLVTYHLNGPYPVEGVTTGYLDLKQYSFTGWSSYQYTGTINYQNPTLENITLQSADGSSNIYIKRIALSAVNSTDTLGNSVYTSVGDVELEMNLPGGDRFTIDSSTLYSVTNRNDTFVSERAAESLNIFYRDAKNLQSESDDVVIALDSFNDFTETTTSETGTDRLNYSYTGNGLTISSTNRSSGALNFTTAGIATSATTSFAGTYSLYDQKTGIRYVLDAVGRDLVVNGKFVADITFNTITAGNLQREVSASGVNLRTFEGDPNFNIELNLLGIAPDAVKISEAIDPTLSRVAMLGTYTTTYKNTAGNQIEGGAGNDMLTGGAGNDTIIGRAGNDTMLGGSGDDIYWVDSAGDQVAEAPELSTPSAPTQSNGDQVISEVSWVLASGSHVEDLIASGAIAKNILKTPTNLAEAVINLTGNDYDQSMVGSGAANRLEGAGGEDFLFGSDGADNLFGGLGNDTLAGGSGNDSLSGGAGDDTFLFNLNIKLLNAGAGFTVADNLDRMTGGVDQIDGGDHSDTVVMGGRWEDYRFTRTSATEYQVTALSPLPGAAASESVTLRNVERVIFAGDLTDEKQILQRTPVNLSDLAVPSEGNDNLLAINQAVRFDRDGGGGNDTLIGSSVGDALSGGGGADSLIGNGGNDTLNGGAGADTLTGGVGNDVYVVDTAADVIVELAGHNGDQRESFGSSADTVIALATYTLAPGVAVEDLMAAGVWNGFDASDNTAINLTGNEHSQGIIGNSAANRLDGGAGDDFMMGGAGADTLIGGTGNDTMLGGTGNDSLDGGAGDDSFAFDWTGAVANLLDGKVATLTMTGGSDTIDGGAGLDTIALLGPESNYLFTRQADGSVRINATSGEVAVLRNVEQVIFNFNPSQADSAPLPTPVSMGTLLGASSGDDLISPRLMTKAASFDGGAGNDTLNGTNGFNDTLLGGDGNDLVSGLGGADLIDGAAGDDTLQGGDGNDTLTAGAGNDSLEGGAGVDRLDGGTGNDTMAGGLGQDVYWVDAAGDIVRESLEPGALDPGSALALPSDNADFVIAQSSWTVTGGSRVEVLVAAGAAGSALFNSATPVVEAPIDLTGGDFGEGLLGSGANNRLTGGNGDDGLHGSAGNDTLLGGAGNDLLAGGTGNDSLEGGDGDDAFLFNQSGAFALAGLNLSPDLMRYTGGIDTIDGGAGYDRLLLSGAVEDYNITRTSATDYRFESRLTGEVATVRNVEYLMFGEIGSDPFSQSLLQPGQVISFSDLSVSSEFDDLLYPADFGQRVDRNGGRGNDTIFGSNLGDSLAGGDGDDRIVSGGGNDTLQGGNGNDLLITGAAGNDVLTRAMFYPDLTVADVIDMDGGAGNDIYELDDITLGTRATIVDSGGADTLRVVFRAYSTDYDFYVDGTTGRLHAYGHAESFLGEQIYSQAPVITVATPGAIETIEAVFYESVDRPWLVTDTQQYNVVYATRNAQSGAWSARGTDRADALIATTGGANVFEGAGGDDVILLSAHSGSVAQGGAGYNQISVSYGVSATSDQMPIGTLSYAWAAGNVEVDMRIGLGIAYDATGADVVGIDSFENLANILGGTGNDRITGDSGDNVLDGAAGNDTLEGAGGADVLAGGAGNDTYNVDLRGGWTVVSERVAPTAISAYGTLTGGTDARGTDTLILSGASKIDDIHFLAGAQSVQIIVNQDDMMDPNSYMNVSTLVDAAVEQVSFNFGSGSGPVYTTNWGSLGTRGNDLVLSKATVGGYAIGGQGDDIVLGGGGMDVLLGGAGSDLLVGRGGLDRMFGGAGNDTIRLNRDDGDLAFGGDGNDTFVVLGWSDRPEGMESLITDFRLNEDFLRFEGYQGVRFSIGQDIPVDHDPSVPTPESTILFATKGDLSDPSQVLNVRIGQNGELWFGPEEQAEVRVVSLVGVDTQVELDALMARVQI